MKIFIVIFLLYLGGFASLYAAGLVKVSCVDNKHILLHIQNGNVEYKESAPFFHIVTEARAEKERKTVMKTFGSPLDVREATMLSSWNISSLSDTNYKVKHSPVNCFRKSKPSAVEEKEWVKNDFEYNIPMEHFITLELPYELKQNATYTLEMNVKGLLRSEKVKFTYDVFTSRSEAIHVNIMGSMATSSIHAGDLFFWTGDGGSIDYSAYKGNSVWLYNLDVKSRQRVGKVSFGMRSANELRGSNFALSDVWHIDFDGIYPEGKYRLVVDGIGCSEDFRISDRIYKSAYDISIKGFYYLRIGENDSLVKPYPRRPSYIPGVSPQETKVYLTTVTPYEKCWYAVNKQNSVDGWDTAIEWFPYRKVGLPLNQKLKGGHADAKDWDRHLGHISIVYDMLLPYYLTGGVLSDDDSGISESGNGIPDILDEARNEVDFWLSARDGAGYSHGVTNPTKQHEFCQAAPTTIAAYANAANSAMLADCFGLAGKNELRKEYLDSALVAFRFAEACPREDMKQKINVGDQIMTAHDLRATAAAYLYNLTGDKYYENIFALDCVITSDTIDVSEKNHHEQLWAATAYMLTKREISYPTLYDNIKKSILRYACLKESDFSTLRPSRRSTSDDKGYFYTEQNVHRTILAHRLSDKEEDKALFLRNLIWEADWGLGRNSLNMIQMGTAYTDLENKRSVEQMYNCGRNDGFHGIHPGQTPYLNLDNWGKLRMARPIYFFERNYPKLDVKTKQGWPRVELFVNTQSVWAYSEFTPQQTMRGKIVLYGYLYAIGKEYDKKM